MVAPVGWTPALLGSTLKAWYKADAGVYNDAGVTRAANGDLVQQWNDQSGGGFNATQPTAGNRLTLSNAYQHGLPAIIPSPLDSLRYLATTGFADLTGGNTFIAAAQLLNLGSGSVKPLLGMQANDPNSVQADVAPGNNFQAFLLTSGGFTGVDDPAPGDTNWHVWISVVDAVTKTITFYIDGPLVAGPATWSGNIFPTVADNFMINTDGPLHNANFAVGEVLVCDTPLSAISRGLVTQYLRTKWGI